MAFFTFARWRCASVSASVRKNIVLGGPLFDHIDENVNAVWDHQIFGPSLPNAFPYRWPRNFPPQHDGSTFA
jgi:hypothetical protein